LPESYVPILLDLQGMSLDGMENLFWEIMQVVRRAVKREVGITIPRQERQSCFADPLSKINEFFSTVRTAVQARHLVLMFDETMLLADKIKIGALDATVFDAFSAWMTRFSFLDFVFSIGSKLLLMEPQLTGLSRSAVYQELGYLEADVAQNLIVSPVRGELTYTPPAVDRILQLTAGQPYYTQLVCHELFNRAKAKQRDTIDVHDVELVRPQAVEMATAQMHYLWQETPGVGRQFLLALAEFGGDEGLSLAQVHHFMGAREAPPPMRRVAQCLSELIARYIITQESPYAFRMGLFRHWILQNRRM